MYITDGIRALTGNVAEAFGGSQLSQRWYDVIKKQHTKTETADEIKARIVGKISECI